MKDPMLIQEEFDRLLVKGLKELFTIEDAEKYLEELRKGDELEEEIREGELETVAIEEGE